MAQSNLFSTKKLSSPLAYRMRPQTLEEIVGQDHILGDGQPLQEAIKQHKIPSMILWGPPGCGKTTLAKVIAKTTHCDFHTISATSCGIPDLRKAIARAEQMHALYGKKTILFIDELHRFNKTQQDALLPHVEDGTVTLIGATTENPSFAVVPSLNSRTSTYILHPITQEGIKMLIARAMEDEVQGVKKSNTTLTPEAIDSITEASHGDARSALNLLETVVEYAKSQQEREVSRSTVAKTLTSKTLLHDKRGENHYNVVSALIKSMRGSDPDGSLYWMMRLVEAGEDPLFIMRRMMIFASEDIGNADPQALSVAVAADTTLQRIGMPEGIYPLTHCCLYLASAPKSNAVLKAWQAAQKDVKRYGPLPVPLKLRNGVTKAMQEWGYGKTYRYPHDEGGYVEGETYFPEKLTGTQYYHPTANGYEKQIQKFLQEINQKNTPQ
ncbi:MAG: replication-associated recombination protein A [Bacteroidota bacterium]